MADGSHIFRQIGFFIFFCTCTTRHRGEHSDQDLKTNPTSGLGGDAITSLSMGNFTKSEPGTKRPNLSTDKIFFSVLAHLGIEANTTGKFHSNPSSSF